jgi:hypothetical protein
MQDLFDVILELRNADDRAMSLSEQQFEIIRLGPPGAAISHLQIPAPSGCTKLHGPIMVF